MFNRHSEEANAETASGRSVSNLKILEIMTNTELIEKFMEWGSPLNQVFVMEALNRYANLVIEEQDELRKSMVDHLIHPEAWIKCAKDFRKLYDENMK